MAAGEDVYEAEDHLDITLETIFTLEMQEPVASLQTV